MFTFTFFGYAAVFVHFEKRILFDPGILQGKPLVEIVEVQPSYVLVTHTSLEHFGNAVPIADEKGGIIIGNNDVCDFARKEGAYGYGVAKLEYQTPMDIGASIRITGFKLRRGGFLAPENTAFFVESKQGSVLHLGHAKEFELVAGLKPDLLCVPVAGKKKGTFSPENAIDVSLKIQPRYALPISGDETQTRTFLSMLKERSSTITPVSLKIKQTFTLV